MRSEPDESSVDDVTLCKHRIVSQGREVSADDQSQLSDREDECFRPHGLQALSPAVAAAAAATEAGTSG